jgi:hypothetical protein
MENVLFSESVDSFGGVNFAAGIWECNFYGGPKTYPFEFEIKFPAGFHTQSAVTHLSVSNYYNVKLANNMHFAINPGYTMTYDKNIVRVSGTIYIGDSDAGVRGLGFFCAAFGKFG